MLNLFAACSVAVFVIVFVWKSKFLLMVVVGTLLLTGVVLAAIWVVDPGEPDFEGRRGRRPLWKILRFLGSTDDPRSRDYRGKRR